jgi:hypothetical protein
MVKWTCNLEGDRPHYLYIEYVPKHDLFHGKEKDAISLYYYDAR